MRTDQEPAVTSPEGLRERRTGGAELAYGDHDRRGLHLAMTDALQDILRWEAARARAARH